jgi:hypothetical protein
VTSVLTISLQDAFNAIFPQNPQTGEIEFSAFMDPGITGPGMKWTAH